jgi:hypothetical protein
MVVTTNIRTDSIDQTIDTRPTRPVTDWITGLKESIGSYGKDESVGVKANRGEFQDIFTQFRRPINVQVNDEIPINRLEKQRHGEKQILRM